MTLPCSAIASPINDIADSLGANDLPYAIPLHPNLVHLTIGLFAIGIAFDVRRRVLPLGRRRVFRFLALPVTRSGFHDVGWYNLVACSGITFFTVAAGFYEMLLAVPLPGIRSIIGQTAIDTMLWHAIGGVAILLVIVAMTVWRGYQRFRLAQRPGTPGDLAVPVLWGLGMLMVMGLHGSLGAWLASDFGVHITADQLLAAGADLQ